MDSQELHSRGLLNTKGAIVAALVSDGWDQSAAETLLAEHVADLGPAPRKWKRWSPEELTAVDEAINAAGGKLPGTAITRPLAERLGRNHKSLLSTIERRIASR